MTEREREVADALARCLAETGYIDLYKSDGYDYLDGTSGEGLLGVVDAADRLTKYLEPIFEAAWLSGYEAGKDEMSQAYDER